MDPVGSEPITLESYVSSIPDWVSYPEFGPLGDDDTYASCLLGIEVIKPTGLVDSSSIEGLEEQAKEAITLETSIPETALAEEDPAAAQLHPDGCKLYRKANTDYRALPNRPFEFVKIHSGRRSTERQAQLYESYIEHKDYGGPPANPANKPGKSRHEYGLAIDVERGTDGARLEKVLTDAGWVKAYEDEGWHFEAATIKNWDAINDRITKEVVPLSDKFAIEIIVEYFEYRKQVRDEEPRFIEERQRLLREQKRLREGKFTLDATRAELDTRRTRLRDEAEDIRNERQRLSDLARRINSMVYDRCPNRQSYEECTHNDLKRQFDNEKRALIDNLRDGQRRLGERERAYRSAQQAFAGDLERYSGELKTYQYDLRTYESDARNLAELGQRIARWKDEMKAREARKPARLQEIVKAVRMIA